MKRGWIEVGVVGVLALLLFALLIPRGEPRSGWLGIYAGDSAIAAAAMAREEARHRADSLGAVVERVDARRIAREIAAAWPRAARTAGAPPAGMLQAIARLDAEEDISTDARTALDSAMREELRAIGAAVPRQPIGVRVVRDSALRYYRYRRNVVLPERPGDPCVIVVRMRTGDRMPTRIGAGDRLLGTCAFYAKYGTPGAGMQAWLVETSARRAGYLQPPPVIAGDRTLVKLSRESQYYGLEAHASCRAGHSDGCARVFRSSAFERVYPFIDEGLGRTDPHAPGVVIVRSQAFISTRATVTAGLLATLAAELGDARFEALWTSAETPEASYARREGRPLSAWVQDFVTARTEPYRSGPWVTGLEALLAFAMIVIAGVASARFAKREMS